VLHKRLPHPCTQVVGFLPPTVPEANPGNRSGAIVKQVTSKLKQ
jgi:hypothetical protein